MHTTTDTSTTTEYRDGLTAAKAWAKANGYSGRPGGWIYSPSGQPVCQGWGNLTSMLTRNVFRGYRVIVDLDGAPLATRSGGERRNVWDRQPVLLVTR